MQYNYDLGGANLAGNYQQGQQIAQTRDRNANLEQYRAQIQQMIDGGQTDKAMEIIKKLGLNPADFNMNVGGLGGQMSPMGNDISPQNSVAMLGPMSGY